MIRLSRLDGPRRQRGLTLIELMVALVISLLLLGAILLMHLASRVTFLDAEQLSRVQENVRFASDYLVRDIRNAGFRDEVFLKFGHEEQIRAAYATVLDDGATLRIRYAGRGHCQQAFDEFRLVENEYFLDANSGELRCRGRSVAQGADGGNQISDETFSDAVGLISGLSGLAFQPICPGGGTTCTCDLVNNFDTSCIGMRVAMQFEGQRDLANPGTVNDRSIELTAAFRNIILDRINVQAFAQE